MKFFKMDTGYAIVYLIISIVIPPLFIINLILLLVQVIPSIIKKKKEEKEMEEFYRSELELNLKNRENETIIISDNDKKYLEEKMDIISNSYMGEDSAKIQSFLLLIMLDKISRKSIYNFIDYLIDLDSSTPDTLKMNEITDVIEIFMTKYL